MAFRQISDLIRLVTKNDSKEERLEVGKPSRRSSLSPRERRRGSTSQEAMEIYLLTR